MDLVFNEYTGLWQEPYNVYHVLSKEEDDKLKQTIRRGVHFSWHHTEAADFPNEGEAALVCVSGEKGVVTYDHAFVVAEMHEDGWEFEDPVMDKMTDVVVHGWMPLPDFFPEED